MSQDERRVLLERSLASENTNGKLLAENNQLLKKNVDLDAALQEIAREYQLIQVSTSSIAHRHASRSRSDAGKQNQPTSLVERRRHPFLYEMPSDVQRHATQAPLSMLRQHLLRHLFGENGGGCRVLEETATRVRSVLQRSHVLRTNYDFAVRASGNKRSMLTECTAIMIALSSHYLLVTLE